MSKNDEKVVVETPNLPESKTRVNAAKYWAMREAMLRVVPREAPGLTHVEMSDAAVSYLPENLFPGGSTARWWAKTVQLDLEAKGVLVREDAKPLRWHQV